MPLFYFATIATIIISVFSNKNIRLIIFTLSHLIITH